MTDAPLERNITRAVLTYLRALPGCRVEKRHGGLLQGGKPDIFGSFQGRHLELEVKRPGAKLTKRQEAELARWAATGAITGVVHSVEDARAIIDAFLP